MFTDIIAIILVVFSYGLSLLLFSGSAVASFKRASELAVMAGLAGAVVASMGALTTATELPRVNFSDSALIIPWKDFLRLCSMIGFHLLMANLLAMAAALITRKPSLAVGGE